MQFDSCKKVEVNSFYNKNCFLHLLYKTLLQMSILFSSKYRIKYHLRTYYI